MDGKAISAAANHLFEVNGNDPVKLDEETGIMFHHNVAKLLFLCKRARQDIQTAIAFLCTRVKSPDTDDYKKLARVMKYLRATINMPLTIEGTNMCIIKWWVDASYAVHPDMRSHTGATMSLGKGSIYSTSTRQKLNTKSSTEAELVGVSDAMSQILWTRYFMEVQGYGVDENVVGHQDNMSTMLLENNGHASCSRRTRHINIRYFFVTYRIKNKEMSVIHCPTGEMVADYFTKPLQGALFKKFRDLIMNVDDVDPLTDSHKDQRSVLGIKGGPTQDSDGNTDGVKDESVVEPRTIDGSIVAGKPKTATITGKLKTAMEVGKNDDSGQNTNMHEKNMHVHTKKGAMLGDHTTYASILHSPTRDENVADKLPEKRKNVKKVVF
eukprot:scaffold43944_cov59-Attheya_sp.AAC.7